MMLLVKKYYKEIFKNPFTNRNECDIMNVYQRGIHYTRKL